MSEVSAIQVPQTPAPPVSESLKRMERAKISFDSVTSAGKWLWGFLAAGVTLTVGKGLESEFGTWSVALMLAATILYFLFMVFSALASTVVDSRISFEKDTGEAPDSNIGFLGGLQVVQVVVLSLTVVVLVAGLAVAAVESWPSNDTLNEKLASRMEAYSTAISDADQAKISEEKQRVVAFCLEHAKDDETTNVFTEACTYSNGSSVTRDELGKLIKRLESD